MAEGSTGFLSLVSVLSEFERISETPEVYLKPPANLHKDTLSGVKGLFDFSKADEVKGARSLNNTCPLHELLVDAFDDEQIWQEIELQNTPLLRSLTKDIQNLRKDAAKWTVFLKEGDNSETTERGSLRNSARETALDRSDASYLQGESHDNDGLNEHLSRDNDEVYDFDDDDNDDDDDNTIDDDNGDADSDGDGDEDDDVDHTTSDSSRKIFKKSVSSRKQSEVDDQFFKLSEMLQFLDQEDRNFERAQSRKNKKKESIDDDVSDNESIDYFMELDSDTDVEESNDEEWEGAVSATETLMGRKGTTRKLKRNSKPATQIRYSDFFDPPDVEKTKHGRSESDHNSDEKIEDDQEEENNIEESADNGEDENAVSHREGVTSHPNDVQPKIQSSFEKKQQKLSQKIEKLEKANLAQKPWQMSGDASSRTRPMNSLLEEDVDFDHMTTTAPVITEETTQNLEDIIKQRIKDEAWDDVERKVKPVAEPFEYKKKQPLDQEKSKLSLSQIYEQEYLKQTQMETEEKENESHTEIKTMMSTLFAKLDALSNFHFTPKPLKPELKVVSNLPVLSVEEVAPVAVSDVMMLAPEEVHEKTTELKGETEKTDTDRKRKRRAKKRRQQERARGAEKRKKLVSKINPGLGNKHSKRKALEKLEKETKTSKKVSLMVDEGGDKTLKSSSAFFSRLQDEVREQVKGKKVGKRTNDKSTVAKVSQLKL